MIEMRHINAEMRADRQGRIEGYGAVFGRWSQDLGGFREKVRPGAFVKSISRDDIRSLFNHDKNFVLGRTVAGTLELSEDSHGLHFRTAPIETQTARDLVLEPVRRGDIDGASFTFKAIRDDWSRGQRRPERELIEVRLFDVGPVTFPAYLQTSIQVRSQTATAAAAAFLRQERQSADPELIRSLIRTLGQVLADNQRSKFGRLDVMRRRLDLYRRI